MELAEGFENLEPYLIGTPRQFYVDQGKVYCLRKSCEDCSIKDECEIDSEQIQVNPIPHPRRAIGYEESSFLILLFKDGCSHTDLPSELWDNPYSDKSMYEANLHFILTNPKSKLRVLKGQIRYYGSIEEFEDSPYSEYFDTFDEYSPQHKVVALDYAAVEPRMSTICSKEPLWIEIFKGTPKPVVKEVEFSDLILDQTICDESNNSQEDIDAHRINLTVTFKEQKPHYLEYVNGSYFCFLDGELDKENFDTQCDKCNLQDNCSVVRELFKNVAGDWHSLNAEGLYGSEFIDGDKYQKKSLRKISKVVGLALCYGGTAWTVSKNMNETVEEADRKIASFFAKLSTLRFYMNSTKRKVVETGFVANLFNRIRDMRKWAHSQDPDRKQRRSDRGYAQRTALNHPIQSTCAELLKIAMIRVDEYVVEQGLNPLSGVAIPRLFDVPSISYRDFKLGELNSVHDEVVYMVHDDQFDKQICEVYKIMQTKDVVDFFGCGFDLELDCEYDNFRSWTAREAYLGSKIFFINKGSDLEALEPNTYLFNLDDLTPDLLDKINSYGDSNLSSASDFHLAVVDADSVFIHPNLFPPEFIQGLGLNFKLVNI